MANIYYMDDNARALYGYTWSRSGRIFSTSIMNLLDLRLSNIIDCAPLGQILGLCVLACAAVYFTQRLTGQSSPDRFSLCVCALPLAVQPFFLENLSYKFDALPMIMAQSCAVFASALPIDWPLRRKVGVCIALIFSVMAFYQPGLNTFVGLSLLIFLSDCQRGSSAQAWRSLGLKIASLVVAGVFYKGVIVPCFVHGEFESSHAAAIGLHDISIAQFKSNAIGVLGLLTALLSGGIKPILIGLYAVATLITAIFGIKHFYKKSIMEIITGLFICIIPFVILFLLSGVMFLLKNPYHVPRTFMSFSTCVIFANLFLLQPYARKIRWVGLLPIAYFFVIAFSYGNVVAENARFQTYHIERVAGMLENAGFETGDDLFLYGDETQSPIVHNATIAIPILGRLLPRQGIHEDDIFGYSLLHGRGIEGREHTLQEWADARTCLNQEYRVHMSSDFAVFRKNHVFCVQERYPQS
ncbi:MAG: glucosyltransferase domain-containing protein [Acetobacter sp.]